MSPMLYRFRPLTHWHQPKAKSRQPAYRFTATWPDTLNLLASETDKLGARLVVIEVDAAEDDVRRDGMLRSNARVGFPGARISFESRHGPLAYATDVYDGWKANVRAIALGLQALRAVDEIVSWGGRQYLGSRTATAWAAAPVGSMSIPLRDRKGRIIAEALVDHADGQHCAHRWYRLANGYVVRTVVRDGRKSMLYLHREVLGLGTFKQNPVQVDHIDGNRLDSRRANLRGATSRQNAQNRSANRGRALPRGVHFRKQKGDYLAFAKLNRQFFSLGCYATADQAAAVVSAWRARHMPFSKDARDAAAAATNETDQL